MPVGLALPAGILFYSHYMFYVNKRSGMIVIQRYCCGCAKELSFHERCYWGGTYWQDDANKKPHCLECVLELVPASGSVELTGGMLRLLVEQSKRVEIS